MKIKIQTMKFWVCALLAAAVSRAAPAAAPGQPPPLPASIPLWPEGVPNAPAAGAPAMALRVYAPVSDRVNGTAVIVCPGGAYRFLATEREGDQYARWLGTLGITAFVLEYRLGREGTYAPLQDVLRAIRLVRSRAADLRISPRRIGVIGSSAGGHLAASAGTLFDRPEGKTGAALDAVAARPDFLMLLYPVITMEEGVTHMGSRESLIGTAPDDALVDLMSLEKQVTPATPPTLLIHSQDDPIVPAENSIRFYLALTRAKVPAEMYLYERGQHGIALLPGFGTASEWTRRAEEWLRSRGLLTP